MGELERGRPKGLALFGSGRALRHIEDEAVLSQAQAKAEAVEADAYIQCGYRLAERTIQRTVQLNDQITRESEGKPGLEMHLRALEDAVVNGARSRIVTVQVSDTVQILAEHGEVAASGVLAADKSPSPALALEAYVAPRPAAKISG